MVRLLSRRQLLRASILFAPYYLSACAESSGGQPSKEPVPTAGTSDLESRISGVSTAVPSPVSSPNPTAAISARTPYAQLTTSPTAGASPSAAASAVQSATAAGVPTDAPEPSPTAQPSPTLTQIVTASPPPASRFTYITEVDFPDYLEGTPEQPLKRIIEPVEYINRTIVKRP